MTKLCRKLLPQLSWNQISSHKYQNKYQQFYPEKNYLCVNKNNIGKFIPGCFSVPNSFEFPFSCCIGLFALIKSIIWVCSLEPYHFFKYLEIFGIFTHPLHFHNFGAFEFFLFTSSKHFIRIVNVFSFVGQSLLKLLNSAIAVQKENLNSMQMNGLAVLQGNFI